MTKPRSFGPLIAASMLWMACGGGAGHDGAFGSAGTNGSGGTTGSGGNTGSGAATSGGGSTGSGGATSRGGSIGSGGTTSVEGGTTGSGGMAGSAGTLGGAGAIGAAGNVASAGSAGSANTAGSAGAMIGSAGSAGSAGTVGAAGSAASAGSSGCAGAAGASSGGSAGTAGAAGATERFSFFVTSQDATRALSGSEKGFGGDLTFGETGPGAGLRGADKICSTIAEMSMPGAGAKGWRAFLSATTDGTCGGARVDAIDRIGNGPWYDRLGRLVAENREALMNHRPVGADPAISNDLPDENGVPNRCAGGTCVDNHDTLTGFVEPGTTMRLLDTCEDWTSVVPEAGRPIVGHSWGSEAIPSWFSAHRNLGCAPGGTLVAELPSEPTVGSGGGYGGIYCFALVP